ncbi:MAG: glycosyltransferase family 4 protein [Sediminibacterium sp.]|nr:glycosyltransferase family 4 protein [Sediminibacterium sp.]
MINLALVSTNKNKYSETFIHNHVKHLPFTIHFLFEGYLPSKYSNDRGITEHSILKRKTIFKRLLQNRISIDADEMVISVEQYLIKNKIDVVLCEYGPSGTELMHVCQKLDVPLVVHFHGYDAFRTDVLSSYGKRYAELFQIAKAIIVVSNDMKLQLLNLQCPLSKLHVLPYGVDVGFFKPDPAKQKKYDFVYCGRFVEKKSPLKIMECFSKINATKQDANLVMIGDGELLEDCKGLAGRLHLEKRIRFTGALRPDEVLNIYQESKIFINHSVKTASNDSEGTPLTILEAMASGLIVLASNHGGIKDVVRDGENGILVAENDWELFERKLTDALNGYKNYHFLSEKAVQTIQTNHHLQLYIDKLAKIIVNTCTN